MGGAILWCWLENDKSGGEKRQTLVGIMHI